MQSRFLRLVGVLWWTLAGLTTAAAPLATGGVEGLRHLAQQQLSSSPEEARATLKKALALARRTRNGSAERAIYNDLAEACGRMSEKVVAQRYLNTAQALAAEARDTLELGRAYLFSALVVLNGEPEQLRYAEQAARQLTLLPRQPTWQLRAQALLAKCYLNAGKMPEAKRVFGQARRLSRQLGDPGAELAAAHQLGTGAAAVRARLGGFALAPGALSGR